MIPALLTTIRQMNHPTFASRYARMSHAMHHHIPRNLITGMARWLGYHLASTLGMFGTAVILGTVVLASLLRPKLAAGVERAVGPKTRPPGRLAGRAPY